MKRAANTLLAATLALSASAQAELIGHWEFNDTRDSTGHFNDLTLRDGALLADGKLDLSAAGRQWANTVWANSSDTAVIRDKTLVSWVELSDLNARAGSAITLDSSTVDNFNGLIWSESYAGKWQVGSSHGYNNVDLGSDAVGVLGQLTQVAATFSAVDGGVHIQYYLDGIKVGDYSSPTLFTWQASDAEVIFGARHTSGTSGPIVSGDGLNAYLHEARLYDTALSQSDIQAMTMAASDVSAPIALSGLAMLPLLRRRRRRK